MSDEYTNEDIAIRMDQTFRMNSDKWFRLAAERLRRDARMQRVDSSIAEQLERALATGADMAVLCGKLIAERDQLQERVRELEAAVESTAAHMLT